MRGRVENVWLTSIRPTFSLLGNYTNKSFSVSRLYSGFFSLWDTEARRGELTSPMESRKIFTRPSQLYFLPPFSFWLLASTLFWPYISYQTCFPFKHNSIGLDTRVTVWLRSFASFSCPALLLLSPVWLCDPRNSSMPGFPVLHHLPELAETLVHWFSDAIQLSHPLSTPSPLALNLSQHRAWVWPNAWNTIGNEK